MRLRTPISVSAEIVLSTLLLEEIQLLQRFQSVHCENQVTIITHAEASHVILQLHIVENNGSDVVGVLLGESLIWSRLYLSEELSRVILDCFGDLEAKLSGVIISIGLGEADSE